MLRLLQEQARHQALSRDPPSDHDVDRAGRRLELVLYRQFGNAAGMMRGNRIRMLCLFPATGMTSAGELDGQRSS
jgi:hypothetical protein